MFVPWRKKMKKKLYLMLVVALILGFAACQDKPTVDSDVLETKQPEMTLAREKEPAPQEILTPVRW